MKQNTNKIYAPSANAIGFNATNAKNVFTKSAQGTRKIHITSANFVQKISKFRLNKF